MNTDHIAEQLRPLAIPLDQLTPDPENVRRHGDKNIATIVRSLREHGQVKPIVVRKGTGIVVAGNGTLAAAKQLGWTCLAAVVLDVSDRQAKKLALVDNRSAELAVYDNEALAQLLKSLDQEEQLDVGFDAGDIDALLSSLSAPFAPNVSPEAGSNAVTEDDIAKAQEQLDGQFAGDGPDQLEVCCPKCANVFKVAMPTG